MYVHVLYMLYVYHFGAVGFYCESETVTPVTCPTGHYCLLGTTTSNQYPCPEGTFNQNTGTGTHIATYRCSI